LQKKTKAFLDRMNKINRISPEQNGSATHFVSIGK